MFRAEPQRKALLLKMIHTSCYAVFYQCFSKIQEIAQLDASETQIGLNLFFMGGGKSFD